jgi:hypothetical protein
MGMASIYKKIKAAAHDFFLNFWGNIGTFQEYPEYRVVRRFCNLP